MIASCLDTAHTPPLQMTEAPADTDGTKCRPLAPRRSPTHQDPLRSGSKAMSVVKEGRTSRKGTPEGVLHQKGGHCRLHRHRVKPPQLHCSKDFGARGLLLAKPWPDLTAGPVSEGHSDCGRLTSLTGKYRFLNSSPECHEYTPIFTFPQRSTLSCSIP